MGTEAILFTIVVYVICFYVVALGFAMVISQKNGVRFVNRLTRKFLAMPIGWLGQMLVGLAKIVRG